MKPRQLSQELSTDIPQDMRDRFSVMEDGHRTPSAQVSEVDSQLAKKEKKSSKKKSKVELASHLKVDSAPLSAALDVPHRNLGVGPYQVGEKLTYTISYLGIAAGQVELEVLPFKNVNGRKVFHFFGHATSAPVFSLVYRLNDTIESFVDFDGLFSHRFHLVLDEKKQQRDSVELYDSEKKKTFYWSRWEYPDHSKKEEKQTADMPAFPQDSLSALFYLRGVPLEDHTEVAFPLVTEGKSSEVVCVVVKRESVRTPLGKTMAVVVRPDVKSHGILKKTGDSFIWFTDDARRLPVRMEARVRVGTVAADLVKVEQAAIQGQ